MELTRKTTAWAAVDLSVLHGWVTGALSRLYARQVTDTPEATWCPEWWQHPEAVARLNVLMATFMTAASDDDPVAMSAWWLDHADPHMSRLFDPRGVFKGCSPR
ncbi:DUF4913 domain-containing protein, partial [Actinoplanes sp. GCM10030250]|uniref:DUF4913 domain-containing protein n=1 Tax=Actinoplanes sp. GCM10030250 TaxID=3273376 RepID=UPI0036062502